MRDVRTRQQPLLAALVILGGICARAETPPTVRALQELRTRQVALEALQAKPEEWRALAEDFARLAKTNPGNVEIRDAFGDFLWSRGDRSGALGEWRAAEKIDPKNASVLAHLASASLAMGNARESVDFYVRLVAIEPGNSAAHFALANVAFVFRYDIGRTEQECFDLAMKHYAEAHRLAPANPEFTRGYAESFYALPKPDWKTALQIWKDFHKSSPEKNFALLNLARVHMKMGDPASARACLSAVSGEENNRLKNRLSARIEVEFPQENQPAAPADEKTSKRGIDEALLPP